jgi:hypothetical protein
LRRGHGPCQPPLDSSLDMKLEWIMMIECERWMMNKEE